MLFNKNLTLVETHVFCSLWLNSQLLTSSFKTYNLLFFGFVTTSLCIVLTHFAEVVTIVPF